MAGRGRSRLLDLAKLLRVPSRTMRYVRNRTDTTTIVYRDVYDRQLDFAIWAIRDDEVLPLLEVLKSLPVAADYQAQKPIPTHVQAIKDMQRRLHTLGHTYEDDPLQAHMFERAADALENVLDILKS